MVRSLHNYNSVIHSIKIPAKHCLMIGMRPSVSLGLPPSFSSDLASGLHENKGAFCTDMPCLDAGSISFVLLPTSNTWYHPSKYSDCHAINTQ